MAAAGQVEVEALTRSKAFPGGDNEFPVLVRVTAAPWRPAEEMPRAGVDVVAVLDVSRSMLQGDRLRRMKQAMKMVIGNLGAGDRLSVVSFETETHRLTELTYMSDHGRAAAMLKVDELEARGGTEMAAALQEGALILRGRGAEESSGRVCCMMFLSDGECSEILKQEICHDFPVHTFGLGADHDPKVMKHIADETSGTYSFVNQDVARIRDAFALFIAGLTSVAATSVKITIQTHEGVTISSIKSGGYGKFVSPDEQSGWIDVADIYAGETKNFIVNLAVTNGAVVKLVTVGGQYRSCHTAERTVLADIDVCVLPPREEYSPDELAIHPEVAAELVRIRLEKDVSEMAVSSAGDRPQQLWNRIKSSAACRGATETILSELDKDVAEMEKGIDNRVEHRTSGLPYMLSWLTSHRWQRATTKGAPSNSGAFQTQRQREVSAQPPRGDDDDAGPDIVDVTGTRTRPKRNVVAVLCRSFLLPSLALLLVSLPFVLVMLYAGGYGVGGLLKMKPPAMSTALDLSTHPSWPVMEEDLRVMLHKTEDVQISSFFHEASLEDMNYQMDQYLYLAIVHATLLRRHHAGGAAISDEVSVRREAEAYLQVMLKTMKHLTLPAFQYDDSPDHITYEMNRYLYSTIVQASVLRSNTKPPVAPAAAMGGSSQVQAAVEEAANAKATARVAELAARIRELETEARRKEEAMAEMERALQEKEEAMAEMERALQEEEEAAVGGLRAELERQRESCAERAARSGAQLRTCAQMANVWKAKVIALGGSVDDEDY